LGSPLMECKQERPVKTCGKCGGEVRMQPIPRYEPKAELMGGIRVQLCDSVKGLVCENCGNIVRADIPDLPGLIAAVAVGRAKEPLKLSGSEIRFLRKTMEFTSRKVAELLTVSEETISRWENGRLAIGSANERLLRWTVCHVLGKKAPAIGWAAEEILQMDIRPVNVAGAALVLGFCRVQFKGEKATKTEPTWLEEPERKAA